MPLGERIKALRAETGWSQAELAERVGDDGRQISRYENGRITPSLDALARIAEAFNTSLDYLVFDNQLRRPLDANRRLARALPSLPTYSPPTPTSGPSQDLALVFEAASQLEGRALAKALVDGIVLRQQSRRFASAS